MERQGEKRPRADAHVGGESNRTPSVRAGTKRTQASEGAPGKGAARVTKIQERLISGGAASASATPVTGGLAGTIAGIKASDQIGEVSHKTIGAVTEKEEEDLNPPSTISQPSVSQFFSLEEVLDEASSAQQSLAKARPAASTPQCNVAGNQRVSSRNATSCRRRGTR